ncbi:MULTISPECIES: aspartate ammonia-lyase [Clostridium]|uniref:aspartate ammonia-lyase n=4 Tax=Clostridium TaxID=1485 RepID=D8GJF1_CLOLD|nr:MULTISPECIES: aspartate ammonia-lyase [Clostridium]ADK17239.1 aspartate ammonia-lyase [Clostridium ljungdahlii DSM 13528]AGY76281.1 aspartate ammonia-lyase [Clostridium autoethanogenum DSM 10061]ALU36441.1 Fumarate hydratase [Clostridium autoethanogenum DSM 10061]OAA84583.1 Aspartate ammonia-lyase [Clostridium ljungdahlii DSM 13528]OAA93095.1 Aspartate ammonia-lyase [Clostridium coskatii]
MNFRVEKDLLGEKEVEASSYFGINTERALENFNLQNKTINLNLVKEIALIKKAAALVNKDLGELKIEKADAIIKASEEVIGGKFDNQFKLSAFQGGAGTSTNMNVNEVIANRAIEILGGEKGNYSLVHPLNDVNMSQSTNDVYPTALRIAAIRRIRKLSSCLSDLQEELQVKENDFSDILKLGRTQLMDALPMMVGQGFGAYAKAIARDRWRIYKVEERLREINIGGTAIGTGLNATNKFIYKITDVLQDLTGLGIARSDYPMDVTQNCDVFVEVSGLLKSLACNLLKISNDLRLLNSGPFGGIGEIILPKVQAGSTIMPGKVNPVIAEMVAQVSMRVISNDTAITMASSSGQLELNAFTPLIAECLLESLELLERTVTLFREKCINGIKVNEENCKKNLENSTALVTALVHYIGYDKASELAKKALKNHKTIREILYEEKILPKEKIDEIINPYQLTKPGIPGK